MNWKIVGLWEYSISLENNFSIYGYAIYIHRCNKLEVEDAELNTPLLMAAGEGSSEAMSVLIKEGARMTRTDGKGNNIVHLMVSSDNSEVLKVSECTKI